MMLILQIAAGIVLAVAFIAQPVIVGLLAGVVFALVILWRGFKMAFDSQETGASHTPADDSDLIGQRFLRWLRGK